MRTMPPASSQALAARVDRMAIDVVATILDTEASKLQPLSVEEIRLPLSFRGLGISGLEQTRAEAYVASMVNLQTALHTLHAKWQGLDLTLSQSFPKQVDGIFALPQQADLQKRLCSLHHAKTVQHLREAHLVTTV
eukprot:m.436808 g.436808  ORF g.436808 m.436808 type:complete len:136 (+) comp56778_c1_seq3:2105-2512(+)